MFLLNLILTVIQSSQPENYQEDQYLSEESLLNTHKKFEFKEATTIPITDILLLKFQYDFPKYFKDSKRTIDPKKYNDKFVRIDKSEKHIYSDIEVEDKHITLNIKNDMTYFIIEKINQYEISFGKKTEIKILDKEIEIKIDCTEDMHRVYINNEDIICFPKEKEVNLSKIDTASYDNITNKMRIMWNEGFSAWMKYVNYRRMKKVRYYICHNKSVNAFMVMIPENNEIEVLKIMLDTLEAEFKVYDVNCDVKRYVKVVKDGYSYPACRLEYCGQFEIYREGDE